MNENQWQGEVLPFDSRIERDCHHTIFTDMACSCDNIGLYYFYYYYYTRLFEFFIFRNLPSQKAHLLSKYPLGRYF